MRHSPDRPRVVFVAYEGLQTLDLSGPWEVLHSAGQRAERPYEMLTASVAGGFVTSSSGLRLEVDRRMQGIDSLDTLVVVGGSGSRAALADRELRSQLRRLSGLARRTASICSGAFLLAGAGLLDGRRAATHWAYCEQLQSMFPAVTVEPDPIFVRDGSLITSAGVSAGVDLALALVEEDHGRDVALEVARWLVVYARRPGGQSQFSVQLAHQAAATPELERLQAWIAEHPDEELSVAAMAARLHLSERQLSRRFQRELGTTPAAYVERARVERARSLLEEGDEGLGEVAGRCGFRSAEVMRRAFQRRLGTSPREYRERFRMTPSAA